MNNYTIEIKQYHPQPSGHDRETLTFMFSADMNAAEIARIICAIGEEMNQIYEARKDNERN